MALLFFLVCDRKEQNRAAEGAPRSGRGGGAAAATALPCAGDIKPLGSGAPAAWRARGRAGGLVGEQVGARVAGLLQAVGGSDTLPGSSGGIKALCLDKTRRLRGC